MYLAAKLRYESDGKCKGPAPAGPVPQTADSHSEPSSSQAQSSGLAPASSVLMFKPRTQTIEGKNVVRQGNGLLKLARLAFSGDSNAQRFLPPITGISWRLPDVLLTPVWWHKGHDKRFGFFKYDEGPFVEFKWKDLWAQFVESGMLPIGEDPFWKGEMSCVIQSDDRQAAQPWVNGPGFHYKFTGVLGWQLPRRTSIQPSHFQCFKVI